MSGSENENQYNIARAALTSATDDTGRHWTSTLTAANTELKEIGRGGFGTVSEIKSKSKDETAKGVEVGICARLCSWISVMLSNGWIAGKCLVIGY